MTRKKRRILQYAAVHKLPFTNYVDTATWDFMQLAYFIFIESFQNTRIIRAQM